MKPTLIAIDTNVLLDFADGVELVVDCFETLSKRVSGHKKIVTPTVIEELVDISQNGDSQAERELARKALSHIRKWGIEPISYVPVGRGIVEQIGRKLRERGLLPEEEVNDSLIVAEAALIDATILLSSDGHLRDIDPATLKIEMDASDVSAPLIASPRKIVKEYYPK